MNRKYLLRFNFKIDKESKVEMIAFDIMEEFDKKYKRSPKDGVGFYNFMKIISLEDVNYYNGIFFYDTDKHDKHIFNSLSEIIKEKLDVIELCENEIVE